MPRVSAVKISVWSIISSPIWLFWGLTFGPNQDVVFDQIPLHPAALVSTHKLVVDVVSIGSQSRIAYMKAQRESWASHPTIRHFWEVTEADDYNPHCVDNITDAIMKEQVDWCQQQFKSPFRARYRMQPIRFVRKKGIGWYCATARPGSGMRVAERFYKANKNVRLPDYLLLVDDDTSYNLDAILSDMESNSGTSRAAVWAGCLHFLQRLGMYSYTPHGGSGAVFNRGALERLFRPINCRKWKRSSDYVTYKSCETIKHSKMNEMALFRNGMTLNELMGERYNNFPSCVMADTLLGYFLQYYPITDSPRNLTRQMSRITPLFNSISRQAKNQMELGDADPNTTNAGIGCRAESDECTPEMPICHHVTPEMIRNVSLMGHHRPKRLSP